MTSDHRADSRAALVRKPTAYVVWGVRDDDHAVVGTTFDPPAAHVGERRWLQSPLRAFIEAAPSDSLRTTSKIQGSTAHLQR